MIEETQQPNSETPDVVRSPKNTDRDLAAKSAGNPTDEVEVIRKLVVIDPQAETKAGDRSPKNDRDFNAETVVEGTEAVEVMRKPIVITEEETE